MKNFIKHQLPLKLFNKPKTLDLLLFDYFYLKFISKKLTNNHILRFHEDGFFKTDFNLKRETEQIQQIIEKQNPIKSEKNVFEFEINKNLKSIIKDILKIKFSEIINLLKHYYNQSIYIDNIYIKRNYSVKNNLYNSYNRAKKDEHFNNYFHLDANTINYFKLFINLQDVTDNHGPLNFYSKSDTKKFVKLSNYKSRLAYDPNFLIEGLNVNSGSQGDSLFCQTTQCLHRASVPEAGLYRDMLFVSFIAVNAKDFDGDLFYFEKLNDNFWKHSGTSTYSSKYSKPKSFKEMIKLYFYLSKNKNKN